MQALADDYAAWWIDFLGEHNHVGGPDATRWLLERSRLQPGDWMLDCGSFVGAAARVAATKHGINAVPADIGFDFLDTGRQLPGGEAVHWVAANTRRLPFPDATFQSVWALDTDIAPREMSRVAAASATICLCTEAPTDGRGGMEALVEEWAEWGWKLAAHKPMNNEATQQWRHVEGELVRQRPDAERRYGHRHYLGQLDMVAAMVYAYERNELGHALFVFARG